MPGDFGKKGLSNNARRNYELRRVKIRCRYHVILMV